MADKEVEGVVIGSLTGVPTVPQVIEGFEFALNTMKNAGNKIHEMVMMVDARVVEEVILPALKRDAEFMKAGKH